MQSGLPTVSCKILGIGIGVGGSLVANGAGVDVIKGTVATLTGCAAETGRPGPAPPGTAVGRAGRAPSVGTHPATVRRKSADAGALQPIL